MTKKGNLAAALNSFDRKPSEAPKPLGTGATAEKEKASTSTAGESKTNLPPSRHGKKALTSYFDPEVIKQLKLLAAAEDRTMQALMSEAINELFKKYNRPYIA